MIIVFSNSDLKLSKDIFGPKFKDFLFRLLSNFTNWKVLVSNTTILFENCSLKIRIYQFWSETWIFFALHETLHFEKFEGADFKYENNSSSNSTPKPPKKENFEKRELCSFAYSRVLFLNATKSFQAISSLKIFHSQSKI